ncbi:MAG: hypothetical protein Q8R28_04265 [Dehalococcoidia bacterium]|nr:hypothetical protein [Dehalococcoidia bacterium]
MKTKVKTKSTKTKPKFSWAVPEELSVPTDPLRLRLDFHHEAITMTSYDGDVVENRLVSALDVAHALASELAFGSGLLPEGALWWANTPAGAMTAVYAAPQVRRVALQVGIDKPPVRYQIPMPPLVFLCIPGRPPWVWATKKRPADLGEPVYKAPLANVYADGRTCPGSHIYPTDVRETVSSFFLSFFSAGADLQGRSKRFPESVVQLWEALDGKEKTYPLDDLVECGTIEDVMNLKVRG